MSCSGGGKAAVCCDYDTETSLSASTVTVLMNYLAIGHSVGPVGRFICITISLQLASDDVGTAAITMQITSRLVHSLIRRFVTLPGIITPKTTQGSVYKS